MFWVLGGGGSFPSSEKTEIQPRRSVQPVSDKEWDRVSKNEATIFSAFWSGAIGYIDYDGNWIEFEK